MTKPNVKVYILWIFQKIKRRFPLVLALTLLSIAVSFSGICFVFFTKELVNSAVASDGHQLRLAGAFMIGLSLFQILGNLILRYFSANVQEGLERDMKRSVLSTLLRSEYSAISRYHSGDLLQRMDSDGGIILQGVMFLTSGLADVITSLVGSAAALLMLAPGFTLVSAALLIAMTSSSLLSVTAASTAALMIASATRIPAPPCPNIPNPLWLYGMMAPILYSHFLLTFSD